MGENGANWTESRRDLMNRIERVERSCEGFDSLLFNFAERMAASDEKIRSIFEDQRVYIDAMVSRLTAASDERVGKIRDDLGRRLDDTDRGLAALDKQVALLAAATSPRSALITAAIALLVAAGAVAAKFL